MSTPASIKGHPIHPMLVTIPIGLWLFALAADLAFLLGWGGPMCKALAFYAIGGGIVGALLAAVPGFVDLLSIDVPEVRRIALIHMAINLVVVALFAVSLWLRVSDPLGASPVAISAAATVLLAVGGWLGGHMVYVYRMGVQEPGER